MNVAVRADAGRSIGIGHVMRCLTLARELRQRGARVCFVSRRQPGDLIGLLGESGFEVQPLPEAAPPIGAVPDDYGAWLGVTESQDATETIAAVNDRRLDWLIVDHYAVGAEWERRVRPRAPAICAIDDLANRDHDCDVLLDQNYFGVQTETRYEDRLPAAALQLLGPRYALLPERYRQRPRREHQDGVVRRVLVFFGGSDQTNETAKAIAALSYEAAASLHVDVVLGSSHPDAGAIRRQALNRPHTEVFENLPSLADLMARADLFVGSAGSTTWERAYCGIPSIVVILAENQRAPARALADEGRQIALDGRHGGIGLDDWRRAIGQALADAGGLAVLGEALQPLVDGRGTQRVARALLRQEGLRVSVRPAATGDEQIWFDWANDPGVRALSFSTGRIDRDAHARWFRARITNPAWLMLVAEDEAELPLGHLRLELDGAGQEAIVSIAVDRCARGIGIGDTLLRSGIERLREARRGVSVIAEVLERNDRSARLFLRRGFQETERRHPGARCFIFHTTST